MSYKKKVILYTIFLVLLCVGTCFTIYYYFMKNEEGKTIRNKAILATTLKDNYASIVKTTKNTPLYEKNKDEYIQVGIAFEGVLLDLKPVSNFKTTDPYFELESSGYYVSYQDITPFLEESVSSDYQDYPSFHESIVTEDLFVFYDKDRNPQYQIWANHTLPIIVKNEDFYGVEWNHKLLWVSHTQVAQVIPNTLKEERATSIPVLSYGTSKEDLKILEKDLSYLKKNGYKALSRNELEDYLNNRIQLPEKSVFLTVMQQEKIVDEVFDILEKYQFLSTMFVPASSNKNILLKQIPYVEFAVQGEKFQCQSAGCQLEIRQLEKQRLLFGGTNSYAYFNGSYDPSFVSFLQQADYRLAFIEDPSFVTPNSDPFRLPRIVRKDTLSIEEVLGV